MRRRYWTPHGRLVLRRRASRAAARARDAGPSPPNTPGSVLMAPTPSAHAGAPAPRRSRPAERPGRRAAAARGARGLVYEHSLEIVQQGRVVAATEVRGGTRRLCVKTTLRVEGHTWLAARAGGPGYVQAVPHHDGWSRGVMAHTPPVYVACRGDWQLFDHETAQYMLTLIEGNVSYIRELSPQYRPGTVTHHHGEDDHLAYLERPFLEARAALHRRMHELGLMH